MAKDSYGYYNYSSDGSANSDFENPLGTKVPFALVEAYKSIRTNLLFVLSQTKSKKIVFSSSIPDEGKTTTAINVAIAFSQLGGKVLLIDGDLRRPTIHKRLKVQNKTGLSSLVIGLSTFEETVSHVSASLDVISSGPIPPNPSEMLGSEEMSRLLTSVENDYDYIFIDTPPLNLVSDAAALSPATDGVVIVVKSMLTTYEMFERTKEIVEFSDSKLLGVVVNASSDENRSKYRARYRKGYYKYGTYYGTRTRDKLKKNG